MLHNSDCFISLAYRLKRQQDTALYWLVEVVNNRIKYVWSNYMFNLLVSFLEYIDFLPCTAQMFFLWKHNLWSRNSWKCFLTSCFYQDRYSKEIVSRWTKCLLLLSLNMLILCVVSGVIYHALNFLFLVSTFLSHFFWDHVSKIEFSSFSCRYNNLKPSHWGMDLACAVIVILWQVKRLKHFIQVIFT